MNSRPALVLIVALSILLAGSTGVLAQGGGPADPGDPAAPQAAVGSELFTDPVGCRPREHAFQRALSSVSGIEPPQGSAHGDADSLPCGIFHD